MGTKHPKNTPFGTQFRHFRVPRTPKMPKIQPKTCPELSTLDTPHSFTTFVPLRTPQIESILLLVYGQEMIMSILKTLTTGTLAVLAMASTLSAKDFSGAELYTNEEYTYGKFEARMKMAAASGTVSSMFLYQNGSEQASAQRWVEVDIEVLGKNPNSFQSNIITGKAGAQVTSEKHHSVSPAADQGFHTYGLEWTPDYVSWTLDGKEVRRTKKGDNKNQVENLIGTQGLRFNIWSSESAEWVGNFDESKLPLFQFINWARSTSTLRAGAKTAATSRSTGPTISTRSIPAAGARATGPSTATVST